MNGTEAAQATKNRSSTAQNWHKELFNQKGKYKTNTKERKRMKEYDFTELGYFYRKV